MTLQELFNQSDQKLISIYCTAGYPEIKSLPIVIDNLAEQGVNFIEVGIPYSDPICDGPTIQTSSKKALDNGITLELIFDQLKSVKSNIPLVMMGYFNVVLQYGVENFCQSCSQANIQAVILPDLPLEIYTRNYQEIFLKYGLHLVFLVTPESSAERIRKIDSASTSFIYAVSTSSTTGSTAGIQGSASYLARLKAMDLKHPFIVGFNVATAADVKFANQYARGVIIGSAFIKSIAQSESLDRGIQDFVSSIQAVG